MTRCLCANADRLVFIAGDDMNKKLFDSLPGDSCIEIIDVASLCGLTMAAMNSRLARAGIDANNEVFRKISKSRFGKVSTARTEKRMIRKRDVKAFLKMIDAEIAQ